MGKAKQTFWTTQYLDDLLRVVHGFLVRDFRKVSTCSYFIWLMSILNSLPWFAGEQEATIYVTHSSSNSWCLKIKNSSVYPGSIDTSSHLSLPSSAGASSTYMTIIMHNSVPANRSPPKQSQVLPWTHCRFQVFPQRELCRMQFLLFLLLFEPLVSTRLLFSSLINKYLLSSCSGQGARLEYKINSMAYSAEVEKIFLWGEEIFS